MLLVKLATMKAKGAFKFAVKLKVILFLFKVLSFFLIGVV